MDEETLTAKSLMLNVKESVSVIKQVIQQQELSPAKSGRALGYSAALRVLHTSVEKV